MQKSHWTFNMQVCCYDAFVVVLDVCLIAIGALVIEMSGFHPTDIISRGRTRRSDSVSTEWLAELVTIKV